MDRLYHKAFKIYSVIKRMNERLPKSAVVLQKGAFKTSEVDLWFKTSEVEFWFKASKDEFLFQNSEVVHSSYTQIK